MEHLAEVLPPVVSRDWFHQLATPNVEINYSEFGSLAFEKKNTYVSIFVHWLLFLALRLFHLVLCSATAAPTDLSHSLAKQNKAGNTGS